MPSTRSPSNSLNRLMPSRVFYIVESELLRSSHPRSDPSSFSASLCREAEGRASCLGSGFGGSDELGCPGLSTHLDAPRTGGPAARGRRNTCPTISQRVTGPDLSRLLNSVEASVDPNRLIESSRAPLTDATRGQSFADIKAQETFTEFLLGGHIDVR